MSTRVGLYGGSFDPPHVCHVLVATWALCRGELDALWVIPTFEHPFGKKMAPFQSRCDMIAAALDHLGPTVRVDPVEEGLGGTSYTIRTVEALQRTHPEHRFSWICGADAWATRESWREWERLSGMLDWLVIGRDGTPDTTGSPAQLPDVSSSDVRKALMDGGDVSGLVAPEVLEIIDERRLYA